MISRPHLATRAVVEHGIEMTVGSILTPSSKTLAHLRPTLAQFRGPRLAEPFRVPRAPLSMRLLHCDMTSGSSRRRIFGAARADEPFNWEFSGYGKVARMKCSTFPAGIGAVLALSLILFGCGIQSIPTALNEVEAAWSEVLNQYKRRSDLIPNLVSVVKSYAAHEKDTFQAVVEARAKATQTQVSTDQLTPETLRKFSQAQAGLGSALSRLMVVVERYPDLKANQNMMQFQEELASTENKVAFSRQAFNDSVMGYNNAAENFPGNFIAGFFSFKLASFLEIDAEEKRDAPDVSFT